MRPSDPLRSHDMALAWMADAWRQEAQNEAAIQSWQKAESWAKDAHGKAPYLPALGRTLARCEDALERLGYSPTSR